MVYFGTFWYNLVYVNLSSITLVSRLNLFFEINVETHFYTHADDIMISVRSLHHRGGEVFEPLNYIYI